MDWPNHAGFEATTNAAFRWGAALVVAILLIAGYVVVLGAAVYGVFTVD